MTRIPIDRAVVIMRRFGPSGEQVLHELPDRLEQRAEQWHLVLGPPYSVGIGGYLVQAECPDGSAAVLKLSPTGAEQARANRLEVLMLRRWSGQGAVLLLEADIRAGTLLMERCIPGTTLDTLPDEEMVRIGCRLASMLHTEPTTEDMELIPCLPIASRSPLESYWLTPNASVHGPWSAWWVCSQTVLPGEASTSHCSSEWLNYWRASDSYGFLQSARRNLLPGVNPFQSCACPLGSAR